MVAYQSKIPGCFCAPSTQEENYCTFGSDAEIVSILMGIETAENDTGTSICNLPLYRTDTLLRNMVKAGCSIALCDPLQSSWHHLQNGKAERLT